MEGSGIARAFQNIYGENTVKHMLRGKAIARANRGHILLESALVTKLQRMVIENRTDDDSINLDELKRLYNDVVSKEMNDREIVSGSLDSLVPCTEDMKASLRHDSRTAQLASIY